MQDFRRGGGTFESQVIAKILGYAGCQIEFSSIQYASNALQNYSEKRGALDPPLAMENDAHLQICT